MIDKDKIKSINYSMVDGSLVQKVEHVDLFIFWGFESLREANQRLLELNTLVPSPLHSIHKNPTLGYGLIITKEVLKYLQPEEMKKLQRFNFILCDCITDFDIDSKVFRFIESKYVDQFFETGELMISSFKKCKNLENKEREDKEEGNNIFVGVGNGTIIAQGTVGQDCLMLCTSLSDNNVLPNGYTYKSAIEISHLEEVTQMITLKLQQVGCKVNHVLYGKCNYGDKSITKKVDLTKLVKKVQNNQMDISEVYKLLGEIGGPYAYFNKGSNFAHEKEVRFVWEVDEIPSEGKIVIKVPEIIRYCKKVNF